MEGRVHCLAAYGSDSLLIDVLMDEHFLGYFWNTKVTKGQVKYGHGSDEVGVRQ